MKPVYDFKEKLVLVTGASRGIGRSVALAFAGAGARVILNYAGNDAAADETLEAIEATGGSGRKLKFDVGNPEEVQQAFQLLADQEPSLDILVNNAGISDDGLAARMKDSAWERTLAVNLSGVMYMCRAALRPMMKRREGAIINLSSVVAQMGNAGQVAYTASKGGVISLSKSLAREVASRGIRVNVVAPGFIATDMTVGLGEKLKAQMVAAIPLGEVGSPEDIADAILWLASPSSRYVTGQVLNVNGGMYM